MALKKCPECGNEVSTRADKCPHCGAKVNKKIGCLGIIGILILLGMFSGLFNKQNTSTTSSSKSSTTSSVKTADEIRKERIERAFSPWDGSHRNLERFIKESMNDPSSYDHIKTVYWDNGSYLVIKTDFRGKNAFGGIVKNWVRAKADLDGNIIEIIETGP